MPSCRWSFPRIVSLFVSCWLFFAGSLVAQDKKVVLAAFEAEFPYLQQLYQHLHAHPEPSLMEEQTGLRMGKELEALGFKVTTKLGGHGVVGVFKNGEGPTVMVRTDLDALPITEKTGLPYASKVRMRDKEGQDVGVMHACGHDMHMTCWVGTARALIRLKDQWKGTLLFVGQPAEEIGAGAKAMLDEGLFKKFPRPDYCLGLHCDSRMPHGKVGATEGLLMANVDSVDILVKGRGGHGSAPHTAIDPIVLSAKIILDLQTIVSREVNPLDAAVVTVGSIHGGTKHNIIPPEVKLQLTVRSLKDSVRKQVLDSIVRITKAAAMSMRAPEPVLKIELDNYTPAVYNDPKLAKRLMNRFRGVLGKDNVIDIGPMMGGEDFSRYGQAGVPIFFYFVGTIAPERFEAVKKGGPPIPGLHSDLYAPVVEPSMRTGVLSMTSAVLDLMKK